MTGLARAAGRRSLAPVAVLILTVATTVCGKDATGPEDTPTPVGTWTLVSIDGEPLPYSIPVWTTFAPADIDLEVLSGQLSINAVGTCSFSLTTRWTVGENVTTDVGASACTWTTDNNAMTFVFPEWTHASASWSGDTLTLTIDDVSWGFER